MLAFYVQALMSGATFMHTIACMLIVWKRHCNNIFMEVNTMSKVFKKVLKYLRKLHIARLCETGSAAELVEAKKFLMASQRRIDMELSIREEGTVNESIGNNS